MIIDTHAHLTDESLVCKIDEVLKNAAAAGVQAVLAVATNLATSRQCIDLAQRHAAIRASVGIHPNYCCQAAAGDWEVIVQLASHQRVAAIGETGLDRYWKDCAWENQLSSFRQHIELSLQVVKPLVIHMRDCADETLQFLQQNACDGPIQGVMHSYTGPWQVAQSCLQLGLYISFAGMVTYKNAEDIRSVARLVPSDRLLVETDSPFLTPHPHRGQRPNTPAMVIHTLQAVAQARGVDVATLADQTTRNAQALFGRWFSAES